MDSVTIEPVTIDSESATQDAGSAAPAAESVLVEEELLVEEVSIDGMCGVY